MLCNTNAKVEHTCSAQIEQSGSFERLASTIAVNGGHAEHSKIVFNDTGLRSMQQD